MINRIFILMFTLLIQAQALFPQSNKALLTRIQSTDGFIALWTFDERAGKARKAIGKEISLRA